MRLVLLGRVVNLEKRHQAAHDAVQLRQQDRAEDEVLADVLRLAHPLRVLADDVAQANHHVSHLPSRLRGGVLALRTEVRPESEVRQHAVGPRVLFVLDVGRVGKVCEEGEKVGHASCDFGRPDLRRVGHLDILSSEGIHRGGRAFVPLSLLREQHAEGRPSRELRVAKARDAGLLDVGLNQPGPQPAKRRGVGEQAAHPPGPGRAHARPGAQVRGGDVVGRALQRVRQEDARGQRSLPRHENERVRQSRVRRVGI
mmetsp:Transcript_16615/g.55273  ORF Transcript_16615/g.55273 Transcript_16615/m.55273 type:complete len:256 (-) Transcript_16615:158-925(-)